MKKLLALSLMLASTLSYADNTVAPSEQKLVYHRLIVEKTKNNQTEIVQNFSGSRLLGEPVSAMHELSRSYLKECTPNATTKKTDITPGVIKTGLNTVFTVYQNHDKTKYLVKINTEYSELLSVNKVTSGACTIETPEIRALSFGNTYEMEVNQKVVLGEATFNDFNMLTKKNEETKYKVIFEITKD